MSAAYREDIQFPAKDVGLREDVHALGSLIGETLLEQGGEEFFEVVEGDRLAAIARREGVEAEDAELQRRTAGRTPAAANDLTRAFSLWFQAVNTAEKVHRVRRRRQYLDDSSTAQPGGIADCVARLQREGFSLDQMLSLIASMSIEPVFTAHPTESTRRTILRKQQRIAQDLLDRLNPALTRARTRYAMGEGAARDRQPLADRGPSARRPDGGRRARARAVLPGRDPVSRRAAVLRGDRSRIGARIRSTDRNDRGAGSFCVSDRGWAATWTAMPIFTARPSARRCSGISS